MISLSLQQACSVQNLYDGWIRVKRNKGWRTIPDHDFNVPIDQYLRHLSSEVCKGYYQPEPLTLVPLDKNGKRRILCLPPLRDRILQSSLSLTLTPLFDPSFEDCSFAYRPTRSVMDAQRTVLQRIDHGYTHIVRTDIDDCFDNISFQLVYDLLSLQLQDLSLIGLLVASVTTPVLYDSHLYPRPCGIPQGSPLSPLLCNVVLDVLDKNLIQNDCIHVRYADDLVLLGRNAEESHRVLMVTQNILAGLGLQLNKEKTYGTTWKQGFQFLGDDFREY